ncbi:MAG: pyruvate dehydrogenase complex dihydrolipoamide acetyltransferase [Flavobacteriales bacterium]|nr:pyruvate dehydrogenase complex dihydrolipoamide acetyltransferase [Flavobacteriales bacterium]MCB9364051.1 pyruvate dehydrogenase complex dihydrolipoamide acetyltransferase [Flavobacteriales bacterium]
MAEIVRMPKLSDTMTDGVVAKWHKKIGDTVNEGDLLAEIETDKATMEFESFVSGTLLYIGVEEGGTAPVDSILAIFGKKGEDFSTLLKEGNTSPKEEKKEEVNTGTVASEAIDISGIKANIVKMPKLSDTMTDGVVAKWHKKVGDKVSSGDLLADIETDKATMEFESFEDGILLYIGIEEGGSAPVESILAIIGEKGADIDTLIKAHNQNVDADSNIEKELESSRAKAPVTEVKHTPTPVVNSTSSNSNGRVKASPLAKKLAEEKGLNLNSIQGTGDNGRIIKRDVENHQGGGSSAQANFVGVEKYTEVPVSQMRKTIARRLGESKFTAPHFYLTISIDMDNAIEARNSIKDIMDVKVSFNDMVIKAAAASLKQHPKVNSSWLTDKIRYNEHVNIGVAVAVDEGLLVPVVRFADGKTLSQISGEVREYATRAKNKQLQPQDWEGSTFTISNLGMFGIEEFTAIINPPDACIMAVGGISQVPVVKNGQVVPGNVMKVTLSCDHRVVDGALGAAFLNTFKQLMENPVLLLGSANI